MNFDIIFPLLTAATYAISSVIIKKLENYGPPMLLNMFRTLIGAVIFVSIILFKQSYDQLLTIGSYKMFYLIISVLFSIVIGDTSYFASQNRIGVKIASPIVNVYPLFSILIAVIFLDENISINFIIGSFVIIAGIIILSLGDTENSGARYNSKNIKLEGLLLAILSMLSYSIGVVTLTVGTHDLDPNIANSIRLPTGVILLYMGYRIQQRKHHEDNLSFKNHSDRNIFIYLILIAGVLGTYLSSLFYVLSVQKLGAGQTAVLSSLGPLFALPVAFIWLKEKITKLIIIGTSLTLIGLYIVL